VIGDANGVQVGSEVGIGNVLVELVSSTGTVLVSTRTAADGTYTFTAASGVVSGDAFVVRARTPTQRSSAVCCRAPTPAATRSTRTHATQPTTCLPTV
jgi:hypothetical protein